MPLRPTSPYYDSFVQNAADAVPELAGLETTWKVIASTADIDARDHTETNLFENGTGVPIYIWTKRDLLMATMLHGGSLSTKIRFYT